ncbi:hypothetical protein BKA66DRAFT_515415 [Pyrenochaeta sp. MPI-SDFR-AT-0127]|nr:hypothetical protein BKA66DRAFT_515415 [Pyrenochaeta sp. MPI-SDFR-AT-0127]
MGAFVNLSVQGIVYFTSYRYGKVDRMAHMFSNHLLGETSVSESTFNTLYSLFDGKWHQQYDISVWTFELDNDTLRIDGTDSCGQISLERVRQGPFRTADISPYVPKPLPKDVPQATLPPPYTRLSRKNLNLSLLKKRKALLCKILQDFAFQWRHVPSGPYNDSTFRRLAYAIIRSLDLNFTVEEIKTPRRASSGHLVRLQDLPGWKVCDEDVIRIGGVSIVISQHIPHALNLARADFRRWTMSRMKRSVHRASSDFRTYLLFSRHYVSLYQINNQMERYTRPECLLDDTLGFTSGAIGLLFEATQQSISTDMILEQVAVGPIERAKVGCVLDIGSIFMWQCAGRHIEREEACRHRILGTPVESRICFDECFSGLAYK